MKKSVLVGQILFIAFGLFLVAAGFDLSSRSSYWYTGPPPAVYIIPGVVLIGAACFLHTLHNKSMVQTS